MDKIIYFVIAAIVLAVIVMVLITAKRNRDLKREGVETDAVVTRI